MKVATIEMDAHTARRAYLDYRARVREHREQRRRRLDAKRTLIEREDEQLKAAYRALSLGHRILNLSSVLAGAGVDDQAWPRLAVARAGTEFCYFKRVYRSRAGYRFAFSADDRHRRPAYTLPISAFPPATHRIVGQLRAVVPAVPAHFRPAGELTDYFVLWEAEWTPIAPTDPLLLKHIAGPMFAVLAQWDLSPVEKMVLEGRF